MPLELTEDIVQKAVPKALGRRNRLSLYTGDPDEKALFQDFVVSFNASTVAQRKVIVASAEKEGWGNHADFFVELPCFELWWRDDLVGLCALYATYATAETAEELDDRRAEIDADEAVEDTLQHHGGAFNIQTPFCFLKPGLQHKGIGKVFADLISEALENAVVLIIKAHLPGKSEFCITHGFGEYNPEGNAFGERVFADLIHIDEWLRDMHNIDMDIMLIDLRDD